MDTQAFLDSLEGLNGKVAVVTGGTQGIGLQTALLLARKRATVYVCALDGPLDKAGLATAQSELSSYPSSSVGTISYYPLDLSSVATVQSSVEALKSKLEDKLNILILNAGIAFPTQDRLSPDGIERTFAVNCLGHFVFATGLLDTLEKTAEREGEARITFTSSQGYVAAKKLDYAALTTELPNDGKSLLHLGGGFQRYLDSKLAVLYLAMELARRVREERGIKNVYVNAVHPGQSPKTALGSGNQPLVGPRMEAVVKLSLGVFMRQVPQDSAKTQVLLSASSLTRERDIHGRYWAPRWSWMQKYVKSEREELKTELSRDREEWKKLWEFCESVVANAEEKKKVEEK